MAAPQHAPTSGGEPGGPAAWQRLEDQLHWYDTKSQSAQRAYKRLKVLEIVDAATLPVVAGAHGPEWVLGVLGAGVVVLEAVQHLYQFQSNWITYRSTAEALKHERFLYLARAGPYLDRDRDRVL